MSVQTVSLEETALPGKPSTVSLDPHAQLRSHFVQGLVHFPVHIVPLLDFPLETQGLDEDRLSQLDPLVTLEDELGELISGHFVAGNHVAACSVLARIGVHHPCQPPIVLDNVLQKGPDLDFQVVYVHLGLAH